jgi:hypothetical protein
MVVNKVSSSINPLATDFKVEIIKRSDGKTVCVIEVKESQHKSHQQWDGRRLKFVPAAEYKK